MLQSWTYGSQGVECVVLYENSPYGLKYLNARSQRGCLVWRVLRCVSVLEEVCFWGHVLSL